MNNELYHHGIKGMHWGIRRFQNKDGSLTSVGKKRYSFFEKKNPAKTAASMSTDELKEAISRLQMEKQYSQLMAELYPKRKNVVSDFMKKMMGYSIEKVTKGAIDAGVAKLLEKRKTQEDFEKEELEALKRHRDRLATMETIETLEDNHKRRKMTVNKYLDNLRSGKTTINDMSRKDAEDFISSLNNSNVLKEKIFDVSDIDKVEKDRYEKWLSDHDYLNQKV